MTIQRERIHERNRMPINPRGGYVLYWMQQSQRLHWNHALEYAVQKANELRLPVLVVFGLTAHYPEANLRHYTFLIEGLIDVAEDAPRRGVRFVVREGSPAEVCLNFAKDAALVVMDAGYLRIQRQWRERVAENSPCLCVEVEAVWFVSSREEYAAATLRPKIHRYLRQFLIPLEQVPVAICPTTRGDELSPPTTAQELRGLLTLLPVDRSVSPSPTAHGGTKRALMLFSEFVEKKLPVYHERRNDPAEDLGSGLSPYLHFGQISPLYVALEVARHNDSPGAAAFLEQLIVRRELSFNFVTHNPRYDSYDCLAHWARQTLALHAADPRPALYTLEDFELAQTHDPIWNTCQQELVAFGTMHNYMRMYWGKKIIEWSRSPEEAFAVALYLNNKYQLDGRDPNSFAGVAWCFGQHDRPWPERPIFGKVRYMNEAGLRRKFDVQRYINRITQALRNIGG